MYKKLNSLKNLESRRLNIAEYFVPKSYQELIQYLKNLSYYCTIRVDSNKETDGDLPFMIIKESSNEVEEKVQQLWNDSKANNWKLIITNALRADDYLCYNMKVTFEPKGHFNCELSSVNVPLRSMYKYPKKLIQISGNVFQKPKDWWISDNYKYNPYDLSSLSADLFEIYSKRIFNKYIEVARYSKPVGKYCDYFIFFQVDGGSYNYEKTNIRSRFEFSNSK